MNVNEDFLHMLLIGSFKGDGCSGYRGPCIYVRDDRYVEEKEKGDADDSLTMEWGDASTWIW